MLSKSKYLEFITRFYISRNATPDAVKLEMFVEETYDQVKWYTEGEMMEALRDMKKDASIEIKDFGIHRIVLFVKDTVAYRDRMTAESNAERIAEQNKLLGWANVTKTLGGDTSNLPKESLDAFERAKKKYIAENPNTPLFAYEEKKKLIGDGIVDVSDAIQGVSEKK